MAGLELGVALEGGKPGGREPGEPVWRLVFGWFLEDVLGVVDEP
jgi:hypothetical protein